MPNPTPNIGQHLFIGITGREITDQSRYLLNTIHPGGVVLFARNVGDEDEFRELTHAILTQAPTPPILAIDQEGRRVNRLRNIIGEHPGIAELKNTGNPASAHKLGQTVGQHLRQFKIHLDFAPVLDLEHFDDATDNALRERCWGRTPDEVVTWAGSFLDGLQSAGVAGCAKHFPGLGDSQHDSHEQLPTIYRSADQILAEDIVPYRQLLQKLPVIMISHGHYLAFDGQMPIPASTSKNIITGLLRQQLGYTGLVVTDDMEMGAITGAGDLGEAVVEAFIAGADMILVCHMSHSIHTAHEALTKAVATGRITPERLAESQERIAAFRRQWI
jgi:beta-N-acetylhexosaminidase